MSKRLLTFSKAGHSFLFQYPVGCEDEIVGRLMQLAEDPDCPMEWLDAATLSFQVAQYAANWPNEPLQASSDERN